MKSETQLKRKSGKSSLLIFIDVFSVFSHRTIDEAIESLGVLIALRTAPESLTSGEFAELDQDILTNMASSCQKRETNGQEHHLPQASLLHRPRQFLHLTTEALLLPSRSAALWDHLSQFPFLANQKPEGKHCQSSYLCKKGGK
jgi:hypothetical protein